jgi:hypothetical protein
MNESRDERLCHGGEVKLVGKMPPLFSLSSYHSGQVSHFNKITFLMPKPDLTMLVNPISPIASLNLEELAGRSASTRY